MLDEPPSALSKNHDRDLSATQILLKTNIPISGDEDIESRCFRGIEQFSIPETVPAPYASFIHAVIP